jgi:mono/diheme cytochrome c family protein
MHRSLLLALTACLAFFQGTAVWAADAQVLRPRVPPDQIEAARAVRNPLQPTPELLEKGRALFEGKAFCKACHGADGKGLPKELELKGPLPRNFDMAPFVPLVLTEEEAWQVLLYVRSFNGR